MLINDRVRLIIKANNLTSSEFADRIGVKRSNLSHVLSGRNKPGLEFLSKIIESFPNVNASWLITGTQREGDFQQDSTEVQTESPEQLIANSMDPNSTSKIEKIVLFYADGSFSEHRPTAQ
jgi:transcriptional regulator with XRE-family HTH domain